MKNSENIKSLIDSIQNIEGQELTFNEEAIKNEYENQNDEQSLAIKILSIFGGLLSCITFLGFLFIAGLYNSKEGLLVTGIIFVVGAVGLNKISDRIIIDTISVSSYVIGFTLIWMSLERMNFDESTIQIIFVFVGIATLILVQNYILSFVATLATNLSFLALLLEGNQYDLIHVYTFAMVFFLSFLMLNEGKIITTSKKLCRLYNPLRIGLIFSLLIGLIFLGKKGMLRITPEYIWLSSISIILFIVYVIIELINILQVKDIQSKIGIYIFTILILASTVLSPAISGAIFIILLSFKVNYKTGLAIGIIAFIYFVSQYYYDLKFTLLTKSIMMFTTGILFLVFYLFTHKKLSENEKV